MEYAVGSDEGRCDEEGDGEEVEDEQRESESLRL